MRNAVALTPYSCLSEVARFEEKNSEYCHDFHSANAIKFFDARPSLLQPNTKAPPQQNGHRVQEDAPSHEEACVRLEPLLPGSGAVDSPNPLHVDRDSHTDQKASPDRCATHGSHGQHRAASLGTPFHRLLRSHSARSDEQPLPAWSSKNSAY